MNPHIRVRPEAELDVYHAAVLYEAQRRDLGREFLSLVHDCYEALPVAALQYAEVIPGVRRALLKRFPYSIYFSVVGSSIVVLAVLHQSRQVNLDMLGPARR